MTSGLGPEHPVRRWLLPARRPRGPRLRASRNLQVSDPEGDIRRPGDRRALAAARHPLRPRPHRAPAAVHPQARRARDLEEPQRPVPRGVADRQRAQVHQGRRGSQPRRRERARPRVPTVDVNDPELGALRDVAGRARTSPTRTGSIASADADAVVEQLRTFGDNTPKPPTVQPSQVKVRVIDATGTNVSQSVASTLGGHGLPGDRGTRRPARTSR